MLHVALTERHYDEVRDILSSTCFIQQLSKPQHGLSERWLDIYRRLSINSQRNGMIGIEQADRSAFLQMLDPGNDHGDLSVLVDKVRFD